MKHTAIIIALAATTIPLLADDLHFLDDLKRLQTQRDKDVAAALDPIDRRYQAALEQLRRKAAQANELETANKIQKAAEAVRKPFPQAVAAEFAGVWTIRTSGGWTHDIELKTDGTFRGGDIYGTWDTTDKEFRLIYLHAKQTDVFKLPVKNNVLTGTDGNDGNKKTLTKKAN